MKFGRLPLDEAAEAGLQCVAFNTDLAQLPCPQLEAFDELAEMRWSEPRRRAG